MAAADGVRTARTESGVQADSLPPRGLLGRRREHPSVPCRMWHSS